MALRAGRSFGPERTLEPLFFQAGAVIASVVMHTGGTDESAREDIQHWHFAHDGDFMLDADGVECIWLARPA